MESFRRMPYVSYMYKCLTCMLPAYILPSCGGGEGAKTLFGFAQHGFCYKRNKPMMKIRPEVSLRKVIFLDIRLSICYHCIFSVWSKDVVFPSVTHSALTHTHTGGVTVLPHCFASSASFRWLNLFSLGLNILSIAQENCGGGGVGG